MATLGGFPTILKAFAGEMWAGKSYGFSPDEIILLKIQNDAGTLLTYTENGTSTEDGSTNRMQVIFQNPSSLPGFQYTVTNSSPTFSGDWSLFSTAEWSMEVKGLASISGGFADLLTLYTARTVSSAISFTGFTELPPTTYSVGGQEYPEFVTYTMNDMLGNTSDFVYNHNTGYDVLTTSMYSWVYPIPSLFSQEFAAGVVGDLHVKHGVLNIADGGTFTQLNITAGDTPDYGDLTIQNVGDVGDAASIHISSLDISGIGDFEINADTLTNKDVTTAADLELEIRVKVAAAATAGAKAGIIVINNDDATETEAVYTINLAAVVAEAAAATGGGLLLLGAG